MSKYQQAGSSLFRDIEMMSKEELEDAYGIDIAIDGSVFDTCENKMFADLTEWATYIEESEADENYGSFQKITGKQAFDDE